METQHSSKVQGDLQQNVRALWSQIVHVYVYTFYARINLNSLYSLVTRIYMKERERRNFLLGHFSNPDPKTIRNLLPREKFPCYLFTQFYYGIRRGW